MQGIVTYSFILNRVTRSSHFFAPRLGRLWSPWLHHLVPRTPLCCGQALCYARHSNIQNLFYFEQWAPMFCLETCESMAPPSGSQDTAMVKLCVIVWWQINIQNCFILNKSLACFCLETWLDHLVYRALLCCGQALCYCGVADQPTELLYFEREPRMFLPRDMA